MRIQIVSDIHLEFTGMGCELYPRAEEKRDLLIVAGDTAEGSGGREWIHPYSRDRAWGPAMPYPDRL